MSASTSLPEVLDHQRRCSRPVIAAQAVDAALSDATFAAYVETQDITNGRAEIAWYDAAKAQWMVTVARYTITTHVGAPPEHVFALWTSIERMGEWVGGVTAISDVSGSVDQAGTTYVVHFGPMKSPTEVLEVERARLFSTKFGSWILRGRSNATFEPEVNGTRITQMFETVGLISATSSWVFSRGSYEGSFRGELEKFARIAEREAPPPPG